MANIRVGFGYDVHQLVEGRPLILGGVTIPFEKGLLGHSDADALLHSICDALLGAANLGDIGTHFPDTDPQYKNIDSTLLLKETYNLILKKGWELVNMDNTITMERPKLKPYIPALKESIAKILHTDIENISIKATTSEKMGFVGRQEGVAVYSTVLIQKI